MNSAIWQQRSKFEPRQSAGKPFFVRREPESERVVAFAIDGEYLILGTREDLVAGALALMAGQKMASLNQEGWYLDTLKASKEPGDLRLLVHLGEVAKTPQFRSYWIQQNVTEMRQYESSITDLYRTAGEYREERALLLKDATPVSADDTQSVADLSSLVPENAGVFKCAAAPSVDEVLTTVEQKVLTPRLGPTPPAKVAPVVAVGEGTVGSASSLEARIDVPLPSGEENMARGDDALKKLLSDANVRAMMQTNRSEVSADGVFVRLHSAVVLDAQKDWNEKEMLKALQATIAPGLTTDQLGAGWRIAGSGVQSYFELDGLNTVAIAIRGNVLIAATDAATLSAVLARMGEKSSSEPATYIAGFRHDAERENFYKMTSVLDRGGQNQYGRSDSEPQFFSQNIGSLSRTLSGVKSESLIVRRVGRVDLQTVRYEWR
jgi:hypothetical protein